MTGVWLVTYKKATGKPRNEYEEPIEEALCFGWMARKSRAGWSRPNKQRVQRLLVAALMAHDGLAKVEAAQANGAWNSFDAVEALETHLDLMHAWQGTRRRRETSKHFRAPWSAASSSGSQ